MARDPTGRRPIPVVPDPPNHQSTATAEQEQFLLVARKVDDALRHLEDLARRVIALELGADGPLTAKLSDFEGGFDAMMLARLTEFERRIDMMAEATRPLRRLFRL